MLTSSLTKNVRDIGEAKEGRYFYGVIPSNDEITFGESGVDGAEIYTIPHNDISAVVSNTIIKEYEMSEENIRRHESVLREVMQASTVLPVEFGTVIHNESILERLLRRSYNTVKECLALVDGMVELGVKAVIRRGVDPQNVDRGLIAKKILERLKEYAEQSISGDIFTDRLLLNESFLVRLDNIELFSEQVSQLEEEFPAIRFLYSGPWPPYSFVYIKIGREGIELGART